MSTINNHVLRSLRYSLNLSDQNMADIFKLADPGATVSAAQVEAMLRREDQADFLPCSGADLSRFLDGLIISRRGPDPRGGKPAAAQGIDNNAILKKLRVAFELKDADMHAVFAANDFTVSKPELSAFFRQPGHRNYRPCGDQILRQFLQGLSKRLRR